MSWVVRVLPNRYADSVRLMGVARDVRRRAGVEACEIATGTAANLEALAALGVRADAAPGDLVIALSAPDGALSEEALDAAERGLAGSRAEEEAECGRGAAAPRSLPAAAGRAGGLHGANLALISVPGEYAALEAHQALTCGLHALVFSDHVAVADELELKRRGAGRGLLVMGPGCGTAMVGGVGLGFANVVRRGPVGIVAAAGTGAQEAACLLDAAGVGVSQIIGVGGRDLSAEVGGIMTREGMRLLGADDETETLLLVSKPPSAEVVAALGDAVPEGKRVLAAFVGTDGVRVPFEVHPTLEAGALAAAGAPPAPPVAELERAVDERRGRSDGRAVLGLFSGGTLAHEAATILEAALGPVGGNVGGGERPGGRGAVAPGGRGAAASGERRALAPGGHVVLDLGEEEYTRGRPHPMVDLDVRAGMLEDAARDERTGCVLLDVVLGHGSHPDPAAELAGPVARVAERATVLVRVCGTRADPQDADRQEAALREAGALVAPSNAAAARLAVRAVARGAG